jgi:hypothetical protein
MDKPTPIRGDEKQYVYVLACGLQVTLVETVRRMTKDELPPLPPGMQAQDAHIPRIAERTVRLAVPEGSLGQLADPDVAVLIGLLQDWMMVGPRRPPHPSPQQVLMPS